MTEPASKPVYPFTEPPDTAGFMQVHPGVYWVRIPLPMSPGHINVWLLEDGDTLTLVDTGLDQARCREAWQSLATRLPGGKPLGRIIVTHYHPDHIGLAGFLAARHDAGVFMTRTSAKRAAFLMDSHSDGWFDAINGFCTLHGIENVQAYVDFITGQDYRQIVSTLPATVQFLDHDATIKIGAYDWQPVVASGHAEDHLSLYCSSEKLLISGDQVLPEITSNIGVQFSNDGDDALEQYMDSLYRFAAMPADVMVLPAHGMVFTGLQERISYIRDSHDSRLAQVEKLCTGAYTAANLTTRLFNRKLGTLHSILAFGETLAHITWLVNRGRLDTSISAGTRYFSRGTHTGA